MSTSGQHRDDHRISGLKFHPNTVQESISDFSFTKAICRIMFSSFTRAIWRIMFTIKQWTFTFYTAQRLAIYIFPDLIRWQPTYKRTKWMKCWWRCLIYHPHQKYALNDTEKCRFLMLRRGVIRLGKAALIVTPIKIKIGFNISHMLFG